ncbi:hypothetical protein [Deinococcus yunweiensis]|uniref:hypothetical protein n=1 Tax=Deinococcus yunweiensis TaxID=367282 RepID=UPI00398F1E12
MTDLVPDTGNGEIDYTQQLLSFEAGLIKQLASFGLPVENVLVNVAERGVVFFNAPAVIGLPAQEKKPESIYIAKFLAATASGLFDAALNYLWDETIQELRKRVENFDTEYFFDIAVDSPKKRNELKSADDLDKLSDAELIKGAREIELISKIGFRLLDEIKYMRNWASAAHPNQNELTGLQLITWLQTCIREVINLPVSGIASNISQLLNNIKKNSYSREDIYMMSKFIENARPEQLDNLVQGLYGIYIKDDTSTQTIQNINNLAPLIWGRTGEEIRRKLGVRLATNIASGNNGQTRMGRSFFEVVNGIEYLPEPILVAEFNEALINLKNAHRNMNNFYNEPPFAEQLRSIVGSSKNIPRSIERSYVNIIVEVFLTNGHGVVYSADPIYRRLIGQFDERQSLIALMSYTNESISSKLQFSTSREKFKELIRLIAPNFTRTPATDFANYLLSEKVPLDRLASDSDIRRRLENVIKLVN